MTTATTYESAIPTNVKSLRRHKLGFLRKSQGSLTLVERIHDVPVVASPEVLHPAEENVRIDRNSRWTSPSHAGYPGWVGIGCAPRSKLKEVDRIDSRIVIL
ncbi:hypothetical protein A6X21_04560 [Planctopirus hydrillae]|uniref:Uncharacterized protein n=1 Tax=Planctopirus hydrillae TaxID=1841610 RepID=A0A1C3ENV8_9PLAN|nr:hypothetical protein A6X21_04560 [Planctopirus hydrillae]